MLAPAAEGATVRVDGTTVVYHSVGGEKNSPYASGGSGGVTVSDSSASLTPGAGCRTAGTAGAVECSGPITALRLVLGDGRDWGRVAHTTTLPARIEGGDDGDWLYAGGGNDVLIGGGGGDELHGEQGDDRLHGDAEDGGAGTPAGVNDDRLWGGPGNDHLAGDGGEDEYEGEAGDDTIVGREPPGAPQPPEDDPGCDATVFHGSVVQERDEPEPCEPIDCGDGMDSVVTERRDRLSLCETENGQTFGPEPPPGGGWGTAALVDGRPVGLTPQGALLLTREYVTNNTYVLRARDWAPPAAPSAFQELGRADLGQGSMDVATDESGGAVVAWIDPEWNVHARFRGPEGEWGADVVLGRADPRPPGTESYGWQTGPVVSLSPNGTAAVAWSRRTGQQIGVLEAAVRTPDGQWKDVVALEEQRLVPYKSFVVTDAGDLYWLSGGWRVPLRFLGRKAGGERISEVVAQDAYGDRLMLDRDGNATAVWTQDRADGFYGTLLSERPAGGTWGGGQLLWHGGNAELSVGVDASGRKTVASLARSGDYRPGAHRGVVEIRAAPFGEPLARVAAFGVAWPYTRPALAVSRAGHAVVGWQVDEEGHGLTAWLSPDGALGPATDVAPHCDRNPGGLLISEAGWALATVGRGLARGTPPIAAPRRGCVASSYYEPLTAAAAPEAIPTEAEIAAPPEVSPNPPSTGPAPERPTIRRLTLVRRGTRLDARVRVFCPARCSAQGSITLRRAGAVRARGALKRRTFAGTRTFTVRLRRTASAAAARTVGRRAELRARLPLVMGAAKPVLRATTPLGAAPRA